MTTCLSVVSAFERTSRSAFRSASQTTRPQGHETFALETIFCSCSLRKLFLMAQAHVLAVRRIVKGGTHRGLTRAAAFAFGDFLGREIDFR